MASSSTGRRSGRRWFGLAAIAGLFATTAVMVNPASASDECSMWSRQVGDSAEVHDLGDNCDYVSVRHAYDPYWSNVNYWTPWFGGSDNYYRTVPHAVLYDVRARGW